VKKSFHTFANMRQLPLQTLLTFSGWIRGARCYQPTIKFLLDQSWLFQQADYLSPDDLIEELGEITRRINAEGIPTRKASARWERSTVWALLRNSAYRGAACFGKTRISARTRVMRPQALRVEQAHAGSLATVRSSVRERLEHLLHLSRHAETA